MALLAAVRLHLPEDRFFLTAALSASKAVLQFIDFSVAASYLDFVNLMAYDFFGSDWSKRSGHHAQLYAMSKDEPSASAGVSYLVSHGMPAKKILLGIPTYGRSFLGASGPGQKFKGGGGDEGTFDYNHLPRKHCKEVVDKRHVAAQCVGGDGGFVSYDNPETVKGKANYCKQKGLGVSCCPASDCFWEAELKLTNTPGLVLLERPGRFEGEVAQPDRRRLRNPPLIIDGIWSITLASYLVHYRSVFVSA